jgi:glyoxylase-like metal-dependent hydrolase (beta-lactamase superfamily II)
MCFVLEEELAMFTGDNILGHGTSAVEDLAVFMASLEKMQAQACAVGYSAHGATITDLPAKLASELNQKLRRERQVMQALARARGRGEKSITVKDLVTEIYGSALDGETRTLALEPFTSEVLKKLAGDGKVGFSTKAGKKKWHSLEMAAERLNVRRFADVKAPSVVTVEVQEILV